mgnify:CR=1 FL=1
MSVMNNISDRAARALRGKGNAKKLPAGRMTVSNLGADMEALYNDLNARQVKEATKAMAFILRQQTVNNLRKGSSPSRIGESKKGKMTRGDWRNPMKTKDGYEYLKGGWRGQVLKDRGANKGSMAYNGGDTHSGGGKKGIISRTKAGRAGWSSITGPRYGQDGGDDSREGYNYAHTLEFGSAHKNWGKSAAPLPARPFLGPAAIMARGKQVTKLKSMMKNWGKGQ